MRLHALRYPGGKLALAPLIISRFPAHRTYVEPFGGGAAVLLNKPRSRVEVYNDLNGDVVNFFRVLRDREEELLEFLRRTPYSREEYREARRWLKRPREEKETEPVRWAGYVFLTHNQSMHGIGDSGWGFSQKNSIPDQMVRKVENLKAVADRLRGVYIESGDFSRVMRTWDTDETLFYLDPPYVGAEDYYRDPSDPSVHTRLREALSGIRGRFVLSYNDTLMVREMYSEYRMERIERPFRMKRVRKKTRGVYRELLIMNFDPEDVEPFVTPRELVRRSHS